MQALLDFDTRLLLWINQDGANPVFDWFFPLWTDFHKTPYFQFFVLPLLLILIFWRSRWTGLVFLFFTLVAVGLNDGFFGKIIKQQFARPRPPAAGLPVIMRAPEYGGFSFPSIHAANMACLAVFVGFYFPKLRVPLWIIAALTAFSRVYCGVHYPLDVIGGMILGGLVGWILAVLFRPLWMPLSNRLSKGNHKWPKS